MNPSLLGFGTSSARIWNSRSEEHTSELQSQSNLVCRLLLEKKTDMDGSIHEATQPVSREDRGTPGRHVMKTSQDSSPLAVVGKVRKLLALARSGRTEAQADD